MMHKIRPDGQLLCHTVQ